MKKSKSKKITRIDPSKEDPAKKIERLKPKAPVPDTIPLKPRKIER